MTAEATQRVPHRSEVAVGDTWDLSRMFADIAAWESGFAAWETRIPTYAEYRGKLASSPETLAELLKFDRDFDREGDRLGTYAFLRESEDVSDATHQGMKSRYMGIASRAAEAASYIRPELLAVAPERMQELIASPLLAEFRLGLERLLRYRPHTLSQPEERLLAMQMETAQTPRNVFDQLVDADFQFGTLDIGDGETIELSHGTYAMCLEHPDRAVRERAFKQYYTTYSQHANTLAAVLAGSVRQDVYYARARNYDSAREMALFPDQVPVAVYDQLIAAVRSALPAVHRYYALRKKVMKLPEVRFYDVYAPLLADCKLTHTWDEGVEAVIASLSPLGSEYVDVLAKGLRGRWCDRYENKGKHSGAFSSGCYDSDPHILMNYRPEVLDHVYTLAHEAGHSMHTYLSTKHQPYQYSQYVIFVAEVASTFNEQLLNRHLTAGLSDPRMKAYFLNKEIDDIRRTIVRQTMFAEFEKITHAHAEANEPLTLEALRGIYRELLVAYFGPEFALDEELSLEGLRIPHFYRAFYVYKYATGLSAAIALAERVTQGGASERNDYLRFLQSGSSKDPLELLKDAGVDMTTPEPVQAALARFERLTHELDRVLS